MKKTNIICVFGDSIAWGAGDKEKDGWVNRLRLFLKSLSDYIKVYNLSVSGDNTDDLLERFKIEAKAKKPDIIIFAIGINDSQYVDSKSNPRVSLDEFKNNLDKLTDQTKKLTSDIIFIGLTKADELKTMPIPWAKGKYYDNDNISQYNLIIKSFCKKNNLLFINMFDLLNKNDLKDGLHPNSQGHQKMFERVKDFLLDNKLVGK